MNSSKNKKFGEIQKELQEKPEIKEKWTEKEKKIYGRWEQYWSTRLDYEQDYSKLFTNIEEFYTITYPSEWISTVPLSEYVTTGGQSWELVSFDYRPLHRYISNVGEYEQTGQGRIESVWVNPSNTDYVLAGANNGGLWKTTDCGQNWECLTEGILIGGIQDIEVDPNDLEHIYLATNIAGKESLGLSGDYSLGVFESQDGGSSWRRNINGLNPSEKHEQIWINPANSNHLRLLTRSSVYESTDGGVNWNRLNYNHPGIKPGYEYLLSMVVHPLNPDKIIICGRNLVFGTDDGGDTWTTLESNFESLFLTEYEMIITNRPYYYYPDELYVIYHDRSDSQHPNTHIEKTSDWSDFELIFTDEPTNVPDLYSAQATIIKVAADGTILAGGVNINRSDNGGNTFTQKMGNSIHVDFRDICFPTSNGNLVFAANDGGIFKSANGGDTWTNISGNLALNEFYDVAVYEADPEIMLAGAHDCGNYYRYNTGVWEHFGSGDGGRCLIDYTRPDICYVTMTTGMYRNENYSSSSSDCGKLDYDWPMYMHQENPNILYKKGLWEPNVGNHTLMSTDQGRNWTTIDIIGRHPREYAMCRYNTDYLFYVAANNWPGISSVVRKFDGSSWSSAGFSGLETILGYAEMNDIWVDPCNPNTLIISFGGFENNMKLYRSVNGGDSWVNMSGTGLPNLPVQSYERFGDMEFVGTDVGLYIRENEGSNWEWCSGVPQCIISDIEINYLFGDVVVATHGRGIYRTNVLEGCYTGGTVTISSTINISTPKIICTNYSISATGNLTISNEVVFANGAGITVKNGGVLVISGVLVNADIVVESGGKLLLNGDGRVILNDYDDLVINTGAIFEMGEGRISLKSTHE